MIVGVVENGTLYFVRTDHIGRPVFATDDAGVKVWEATYLPFGGVHTSTGPNSALRFPGQWFQSETGLHQNWMWDYDPTTGRYMQADPFGLIDGPAIYGYALQNPGRYIDPRGEFLFPAIPIGIAIYRGFRAALAVIAAINAITGPSIPSPEPTDQDDECKRCPPCETISGKIVPVGTPGYHDTHSHWPVEGPHYNIFFAQQIPATAILGLPCSCFWAKRKYALSPEEHDWMGGIMIMEPFKYNPPL